MLGLLLSAAIDRWIPPCPPGWIPPSIVVGKSSCCQLETVESDLNTPAKRPVTSMAAKTLPFVDTLIFTLSAWRISASITALLTFDQEAPMAKLRKSPPLPARVTKRLESVGPAARQVEAPTGTPELLTPESCCQFCPPFMLLHMPTFD